jgi:hypothetical protein
MCFELFLQDLGGAKTFRVCRLLRRCCAHVRVLASEQYPFVELSNMLCDVNNLAECLKCFGFLLEVLRECVVMRVGRGQWAVVIFA